VPPVGQVVDEAGEVHARTTDQMTQKVPRADLVALVGRVRQAMCQEEDVGPAHPRPRETIGPSVFATGSGSRFQAATASA
jgi:hypothetical protein